MRLSNRLISTFLFFLLSSFSLLVPSVGAIRRRHSSKPENAIIAARQYHPRTLGSRDLIDLCINLDASLNLLPPLLKDLLVGQVDVCLCLKDLDIFLNAKVKDLGILGGLINVPKLKILLNDLMHSQGSECTLPPHAHYICTNDPCHFDCDDGFTRVGKTCECLPPKKLCNGQCLASPNACDPSPVPRARMARRSQIRTLEAAKNFCQGKEVCGVPSSESKHAFECVDVTTTLDSCGGCVYPHPWETTETRLATGKDCTALATGSVLRSTCQDSRCVVDKCQPGFKPNPTGDDCIAIGHTARADISDPTEIDLNPLGLDVVAVTDLGEGLNSVLNGLGEALVPSLIHPVDSKGPSSPVSCPSSPPDFPDAPPITLDGLIDLTVDLVGLGYKLDGLVGLLGSKCNCHDTPAPSDTAALVKSVIDLTLQLTVELGLIQSDISHAGGLGDLVQQLLDTSKLCLGSSELDLELKVLIGQLVDLTNRLLTGLQLLLDGVQLCGCQAELVESLLDPHSLTKRSFSSRRGEPCTEGTPSTGLNLSVDAKVNLKRRDDTDPVEVDLNPLGINSVVTLDVGSLNPTVNQLGEALVPSLIHPVDRTGSSCPVSAPPPATPPTTLKGLTVLVYHLLDQLLGLKYLGNLLGDQCGCQDAPPSSTGALVKGLVDLTANLDFDVLQADPTDIAGLTALLNQILDAANSCLAVDDLDLGLNNLISQVVDLVNTTLAGLNLVPTGVEQCGCKSDLVDSLAGSVLTRRADPCIASGTGGTSGSGSNGTGPGSGAIADPSEPVHIDLQCVGLNGDVVADLGGLNSATNELLDPPLGPLVHADGVSPCARSSSGVPSRSASSATTPTSSPTSSRSPVSSSGSKAGTNGGEGDGDCKNCKGPSGSTDPSKPVLVDLTPIGVNAKATVDAGPELNILINNWGSLLSPIIRPADSASGLSSPASSGSPAPPGLVADLHAALNLGSIMAATAKKLYTSCGCSGDATSPVLVVIALTTELEGALQVMKANPTDATVSAVLKLVDAVLAASKTCSVVPGLKADIVASVNALIGNCNDLAVSLKALLKGLKTCGCSEGLAASVSGSASGSIARSKMLRKRYIGGSH